MSGCSQTQVERDAHLALDNRQQETMRLLSQLHAEVRDLGQLLPSEDAIQILTSLRDSSSTVAHYLQMQFVDSVNDERPYNYSNYITAQTEGNFWSESLVAEAGDLMARLPSDDAVELLECIHECIRVGSSQLTQHLAHIIRVFATQFAETRLNEVASAILLEVNLQQIAEDMDLNLDPSESEKERKLDQESIKTATMTEKEEQGANFSANGWQGEDEGDESEEEEEEKEEEEDERTYNESQPHTPIDAQKGISAFLFSAALIEWSQSVFEGLQKIWV